MGKKEVCGIRGVVCVRAQGELGGVSGASCRQDERLCELISKSVLLDDSLAEPILHIIDCRPKSSANANKLTGHGFENSSNYTTSTLKFMNIGNIHAMRESFQRLQALALGPQANDTQWNHLVEDTKWLGHARSLLAASHEVATIVHERREPVLVHCSHGWDRTSQVTAIAS